MSALEVFAEIFGLNVCGPIRPVKVERLTWLPFELRLINGMNQPVPEVTVLVDKITMNRRERVYEFHIKKVLGFKHWDKRRKVPKR